MNCRTVVAYCWNLNCSVSLRCSFHMHSANGSGIVSLLVPLCQHKNSKHNIPQRQAQVWLIHGCFICNCFLFWCLFLSATLSPLSPSFSAIWSPWVKCLPNEMSASLWPLHFVNHLLSQYYWSSANILSWIFNLEVIRNRGFSVQAVLKFEAHWS